MSNSNTSNPNNPQDKNQQQQQGGGRGQQSGGSEQSRRQTGGKNPATDRDSSDGASRQDVSNDSNRGSDEERSSDRI
jgi:hypothetical protein